jgi:cation transport regulator ChaB
VAEDTGSESYRGAALPRPDPTVLTTEQLLRTVAAERDYLDAQLDVLRERLSGIDKATRLLNETVNRVPTDVTKEVTHLRELMDQRFNGVQDQFHERDVRVERESRDNKVAVDAAFAAQKEAASEQNRSNTLAISKSENATTEKIDKLSELFKTTTGALADKIDDIKERTGRIESVKEGSKESREGLYGLIGAVLAVVVLLGILAATGVFGGDPTPPVVTTPTVTVTTPNP